jgi:hypothetical protein
VRLVPVRKPTFPDQQQDLQNAAEHSVASECDRSVKFPRRAVETDSEAIWLPGMVQVGESVPEVQKPFLTTFSMPLSAGTAART